MSKKDHFRYRSVVYLARRFGLRSYSFTLPKSAWIVAIRGNVVVLSFADQRDVINLPDIRKLGNEKDYELFFALTSLGTKQFTDYQIVASGGFESIISRYNRAIFARTGSHVYSTRWRRMALAHARFMRHRMSKPPCVQIAEDVQRGMMMVTLNYLYYGSVYIFSAGIPVDYAYPFHEECMPERHIAHYRATKSIVPWLCRLDKTEVLAKPLPPPTLEEVYNQLLED